MIIADDPIRSWRESHPEAGDWLYLDGGTLDIGIIRDAAWKARPLQRTPRRQARRRRRLVNARWAPSNDFRVFIESFERVAMRPL